MDRIICEVCGSNDVLKKDDVFLITATEKAVDVRYL